MPRRRLLAVLLTVLVLGFSTGTAAAVTVDQLHPEQASQNDRATGSFSPSGPFSFMFSFLRTSQIIYEPGSSATLNYEIEGTQDAGSADIIVEVNKCLDGVSWSDLTRGDCNNNKFGTVIQTRSIDDGQTYSGQVTINELPTATGNYEVVVYALSSDGSLVSDAPNKFITVAQDSDGDGVFDQSDDCPETAGSNANGCPSGTGDADGDGVADEEDACDNQAGPASNTGCPTASTTDADQDGIIDATDSCPDTSGPATNNGCPRGSGGGGSLLLIAGGLGLAAVGAGWFFLA